MKCFNEHLPTHQQFCQTNKITAEPEKSATPLPTRRPPPTLTVERIDDNLYKLVAEDKSGKSLDIKAVDVDGYVFKKLKPDSLFRYTDAGGGKGRQHARNVLGHGRVQELHGHGTLTITATNSKGKVATAEVLPAEPSAPNLELELVDKKKHLYKIKVSDDSGEPVVLTVTDSEGNIFESLGPDGFFRYTKASHDKHQERSGKDDQHNFQHLSGFGDLTITATNQAGKKSKVEVPPREEAPPIIKIEDLGKGLHRIVASDEESGEPVTIEAVDSQGNPFTAQAGTVFSYVEAGNGSCKQQEKDDPVHGKVQKLTGYGDLTVTAVSQAGKKASATVQPKEASPPNIKIEDLGEGLHRIVASDESGDPITIEGVDSKGHPFTGTFEPGSVFTYTDAGNASAKQEEAKDPVHGKVQKLHGHGNLTVTATNTAGKEAKAKVHPSEASPPKIKIEYLGGGLHRIVASDESGDPVTLEGVDNSTGHPFTGIFEPGTVFSYTEAGNGSAKQTEVKDPVHGKVQKLRGHGDLTVTATNTAGKEAKAKVHPSEASPPKIKIEDLGKGLHRIVASDESGDPVTLEGVDNSTGHPFTGIFTPGAVFSYTEAGNGSAKQTEVKDPVHGKVQKLRGHGDLTVTATNTAGKEAKAKVHPSEASPPNIKIEDLGEGLHRIVASDESGDPVTLEGVDSKGHPFTGTFEPGTLFTYTNAGDGYAKLEEAKDPVHGKVQKLHGHGDLMVTATNTAGKKADVFVHPAEASEPKLELEEVEDGLYKIMASDDSGPVKIEAVDSNGNKFGGDFGPGTLFRYTEGENQREGTDNTKHGKAHNLQGPAPELWIYCYNMAGQKQKRKVKASKQKEEKKEPRKKTDLEDEDFKYKAEGWKLPSREKEERVLTKEVADKLIFWYGRLGHPTQKDMKRRVAKLPPSCRIHPEDVDLMPWKIRGTILDTKKLYEIIAELDGGAEGSDTRDSE
jgi:hypothetical protein